MLNNGFSFTIERDQKRARLVVYNNGVENVCRKESFKNLKGFALLESGKIFKGRLRLHKDSAGITVIVKGKPAGSLTVDEFMDCISEALAVKHLASAQTIKDEKAKLKVFTGSEIMRRI